MADSDQDSGVGRTEDQDRSVRAAGGQVMRTTGVSARVTRAADRNQARVQQAARRNGR